MQIKHSHMLSLNQVNLPGGLTRDDALSFLWKASSRPPAVCHCLASGPLAGVHTLMKRCHRHISSIHKTLSGVVITR